VDVYQRHYCEEGHVRGTQDRVRGMRRKRGAEKDEEEGEDWCAEEKG
jgi:hypothetical protein